MNPSNNNNKNKLNTIKNYLKNANSFNKIIEEKNRIEKLNSRIKAERINRKKLRSRSREKEVKNKYENERILNMKNKIIDRMDQISDPQNETWINDQYYLLNINKDEE